MTSNTGISTLQRRFLTKRFLRNLIQSRKMIEELNFLIHPDLEVDHTSYQYLTVLGNHFDQLTDFIRQPVVLKTMDQILEQYYRVVNFGAVNKISNLVVAPQITGRIFLSAYVLAGYPEFALSRHHHQLEKAASPRDLEYDIYVLANELIIDLFRLTRDNTLVSAHHVKFRKSMNRYSNCFMIWSNQDKMKKMNELFEAWHANAQTMDEVYNSDKYDEKQKEDVLAILARSQEKLFVEAKKLTPDVDIKKFQLYHQTKLSLTQVMQKAYWDKLQQDLNKGNYEMVMALYLEIVQTMKGLRNGNKDFSEHLDDKIAPLIQEIKNKTLTKKTLMEISSHLAQIISLLQSPVKTSDSLMVWKAVRSVSESLSLEATLPKVLEYMYSALQEIKDDLVGIYAMMMMGINPFQE